MDHHNRCFPGGGRIDLSAMGFPAIDEGGVDTDPHSLQERSQLHPGMLPVEVFLARESTPEFDPIVQLAQQRQLFAQALEVPIVAVIP